MAKLHITWHNKLMKSSTKGGFAYSIQDHIASMVKCNMMI